MLKVTLVKSLIAGVPRNVKTSHALGLRKIGQTNTFDDTPVVRGMIHQIKHLVTVEVVEDQPKKRRRVLRGQAASEAAPAPEAPNKEETA
jgi:large subunit ribosomal protein L30